MFPCRTLPLGIRNVVDKLFIVKSPRSLRCSLNIFPMLCPIHIRPLFHQEFHKGWARLILLAHGHGPMKPVRPHFLFLSSSFTITLNYFYVVNKISSSITIFFFFLQWLLGPQISPISPLHCNDTLHGSKGWNRPPINDRQKKL